MNNKITVVFVLSPGHSGSTLLELMLGAHSRVASGGEIKMLAPANQTRTSVQKRSCTCGGGLAPRCDFWRAVDAELLRADGLTFAELDVESAWSRVSDGTTSRSFARSPRSPAATSSSTPRRTSVASSACARSPSSTSSRSASSATLGARCRRMRKGRPLTKWARHYTRHILLARKLLAGVEHAFIRYESLATDPQTTMTSLMTWLGQSFEPSQLKWHDRKQHSIGGNTMRFEQEAEVRLDTRWKTELTARQIALIGFMTWPTRLPALGPALALRPLWELDPRTTAKHLPAGLKRGLARWGKRLTASLGLPADGNEALEKNRFALSLGVATTRLRALPDFVIAGGQRCGTTSLYQYLAEHPSIGAPVTKEVHYFDRDENHTLGPRFYRAHFPTRAELAWRKRRTGHALTFEATPAYLHHPIAAKRMADLLPHAKVIVMLRDPVNRCYSDFNVHGGEATFAEEVERRFAAFDVERARAAGRWRGPLERGLYVEQLPAILERYGRERVLVLRSEDLFADPPRVYAEVLEFLGLPQYDPGRFDAFGREVRRQRWTPGSATASRVFTPPSTNASTRCSGATWAGLASAGDSVQLGRDADRQHELRAPRRVLAFGGGHRELDPESRSRGS